MVEKASAGEGLKSRGRFRELPLENGEGKLFKEGLKV